MPTRTRARFSAVWLLVAAALAGGCGSTSLVNMWTDSSYGGAPLRRRIFEDALCGELAKRGVSAVPSYRIFPDGPPAEDACKAHVTSGNYDGLIVVKRAGRQTRQNYVPGYSTVEPVTRYNPWWGTWDTAYREVYTPGYVETETALRFEIMVYGLRPGNKPGPSSEPSELLWTGTTETIDPTSSTSTSKEISSVVVPELAKAKII
jgi:hypothetical protein